MADNALTGPMRADLLLLAELYARLAGTNDCPDLRGPAEALRTGRALEVRGMVELGNRWSVNHQPRWWLTEAGFVVVSVHIPALMVLAADADQQRLARRARYVETYGIEHQHHEGVPLDHRGPCFCSWCYPNGPARPDAIARLRCFAPRGTTVPQEHEHG